MSAFEGWLSIEEAAALEGLSLRGFQSRFHRNRASFTTRQIPSEKQTGKTVTQILLTSLSPAAQRRYREAHVEKVAAEAQTELTPLRPDSEQQQAWYNALPLAYKERVGARINIVNEYHRAIREMPHGRSYGYRTVLAQDIALKYDVSRGTVFRLIAAFEAKGITGFADERFGQRRAKLTSQMEEYLVGIIGKRSHVRPARLREYVEAEFNCTISYSTVHRWLMQWKERNRVLYATLKNPDDAKNRYQWAPGDMDAKALFFLHYVEMDSTPADLLCADGKRYTLIGAIDIYSRLMKVIVAPTSNSHGIATLFRDVVTDWGVPENIVKDNGQDYVSKHITQIQAAFAIHSPFVPKFTPEAKPHIERGFGTLARGCLEELAGYVGHSVAERKGIEARRSFADRLMKKGEVIEIGLMPDQLQTVISVYTDTIYAQRRHSELGVSPVVKRGQSPKQPARVTDLAALQIVLLPEAERTVNKKGIRIDNGVFFSAELTTRTNPGDTVRVKIDSADITKLYVFDELGRFLCLAWDTKARPVTAAEAIAVKKAQKKLIAEKVKAVKTLAATLPDPAQRLYKLAQETKQIAAFRGSVEFKNDALGEAARAAAGKPGLGAVHTIADGMAAAGLVPPEARGGDEDPLAWMGNTRLKVVNDE